MTQDSESVVMPRDQQRQLDAEQLMDAAGTLSRCGYGEDAEEVRAIALRLATGPFVREELRNEVKRLISEHVAACLRMSSGGVIPTLLHPGPTADAIIAALAAAPSTSVREEETIVQLARRIEAALCSDGERTPGSMWASDRGREQMMICARVAFAALVPSTDEEAGHAR